MNFVAFWWSLRLGIRRFGARPLLPLIESTVFGFAISVIAVAVDLSLSLPKRDPTPPHQIWVSSQLYSNEAVGAAVQLSTSRLSVTAAAKQVCRVATPWADLNLPVFFVEPTFFRAMNVGKLWGSPSNSDASLGVILNQEAWSLLFHDRDTPRASVRVNGRELDVLGVTDANLPILDPFHKAVLFVPSRHAEFLGILDGPESSSARWMHLIARGSLADRDDLSRQLAQGTHREFRDGPRFISLREHILRSVEVRRSSELSGILLIVGAGLALMILVNGASNLSRSAALRSRERALEIAFGARGFPLFADTAIGGTLKWILTTGLFVLGYRLLRRAVTNVGDATSQQMPGASAEPPELLFWWPVAIALVGILATCVPAIVAIRRRASQSPAELLRVSVGFYGELSRASLLLAVLQIAVAVSVTVLALVSTDSLIQQLRRPLGFDRGRIVVVRPLVASREIRDPSGQPLHERLMKEFEASDLVEAVSIAAAAPFGDELFLVEVVRPDGSRFRAALNTVGPSFLDVMGTRVVAGHRLVHNDGLAPTQQVVVNVTFTRVIGLSPHEAVGQRLDFGGGMRAAMIVGVVEDGVFETLTESQWPTVFVGSSGKVDPSSSLVLRIRDVGRDRARVEQLTAALVQDSHRFDIYSLDERAESIIGQAARWSAATLLLSLLSVAIAAVGLWVQVAESLRRRGPVIALRQALGASPFQALKYGATESLMVVVGGCLLGILVSWSADPVIRQFFSGSRIQWAMASALTLLLFGACCLAPVGTAAFRFGISQPDRLLKEHQG